MDHGEIPWPLTPEGLAALPQAQYIGMGNKKTWRAVHGKYYRHWNNYLVKACKQGNRDQYNRSCLECGSQTLEQSDKCPKHGGPSRPQKHCSAVKNGAPCGRQANHKTDKEPRCIACYIIDNPERGCSRGCKQMAVLTNDEGLCCNCIRNDKTAANKNSKHTQLYDLLKRGDVVRAPPMKNCFDVSNWKPGTKYAMQSQQDNQNYGLFILCGKQPARACMELNCMQFALKTPGKKFGTHCMQHGGGPRCKGSDPKNAPHQDCPTLPYPTGVVWPGCKADHYRGRCVHCFIRTDPNHPLAKAANKYQMARQQKVIEVLERAFPDYKWSIDRAFCVGVKKRPDAKVRTADRILVVEIDEDSHKREKCPDERVRELEFRTHAGNAEICMIRFNPDGYECPITGTMMPSCFKFCAPPRNFDDIPEAQRCPTWGTTTLDPNQNAEWEARCNALCAWVSCLIDPADPAYMPKIPPPQQDRYIWTVELYYDHVKARTPEEWAAHEAKMRAKGKRIKAERERAMAAANSKRPRVSTPSEASCSADI